MAAKILFVLFSMAFWLVAAFSAFAALFGPCGLAPDESCELDPPMLSFLDGVSPNIVILAAALIYCAILLGARALRRVR